MAGGEQSFPVRLEFYMSCVRIIYSNLLDVCGDLLVFGQDLRDFFIAYLGWLTDWKKLFIKP